MNTGIICEFNPFHAGHKYLIDKVKNDGDAVICVMSGNFVQRGEMAVFNKAERTRLALLGGADLVIELPTVYATKSAEGFARAGISLIEATGIADNFACGAECEDADLLYSTAAQIKKHQSDIAKAMKDGLTYPAARRKIINSSILDSPNNILALEYIEASTALNGKFIKRIGGGHDSDDEKYSASAVRKTLSQDAIVSLANCEKAVLAVLRRMSADDFSKIEDVGDGLENRLYQISKTATTLEELYDGVKAKCYTHARIRRIILRAFLGIEKNMYPENPPYLRILGFNDNGKQMLFQMKDKATLPIVTRTADIKKLDSDCKNLFELECRCTDLYNLGYKKPLPGNSEQRFQIVSI